MMDTTAISIRRFSILKVRFFRRWAKASSQKSLSSAMKTIYLRRNSY